MHLTDRAKIFDEAKRQKGLLGEREPVRMQPKRGWVTLPERSRVGSSERPSLYRLLNFEDIFGPMRKLVFSHDSSKLRIRDEHGTEIAFTRNGTVYAVNGHRIATLRGGIIYAMDGQLVGRLTLQGAVLDKDGSASKAFLRLLTP